MAEKILMLALSPTMDEGKIIAWKKNIGDEISSGDVLAEVETDKASMDLESSSDGVLLKIIKPAGDSAKVGETIGYIGAEGETVTEESPLPTPSEKPSPPQKTPPNSTLQVPPPLVDNHPSLAHHPSISPYAQTLASQSGIDITTITGSGPHGRIIARDIKKAIDSHQSDSTPDTHHEKTQQSKIEIPNTESEEIQNMQDAFVPHSMIRKTIAKRLSESKFTAPHYHLSLHVSMDALMKTRKDINAKRETKLSLNAFLIEIISKTLIHHPYLNSSWKEDGIIFFGEVNLGVAVAIDNGLITPIVPSSESKGIEEIDLILKDRINRAKTGELSPEEFNGATFTITNLGSFGIEEFSAIINPPGSAILAIGKIEKKPIVIDDKITVSSLMNLTLNLDHRVVDGAIGAVFLSDLKSALENPLITLL